MEEKFTYETAYKKGMAVPTFGQPIGDNKIEIEKGFLFSELQKDETDASNNKVILEKNIDGYVKKISITEQRYKQMIDTVATLQAEINKYAEKNEWMYNMAQEKYHEAMLTDSMKFRVNEPKNFIHNLNAATILHARDYRDVKKLYDTLYKGLTKYDRKHLDYLFKAYGKKKLDAYLHNIAENLGNERALNANNIYTIPEDIFANYYEKATAHAETPGCLMPIFIIALIGLGGYFLFKYLFY